MENKLKNLKQSMTTTVLSEIEFDRSLEMKIKKRMLSEKDPVKGWKFKPVALAVAIPGFLLTVFFLSANVSPTVASVIEKIPYLNTMFTHPSMEEKLAAPLLEKGIDLKGINVRAFENDVLVVISGSDDYLKEVKSDVIHTVKEALSVEGHSDYDVTVQAFAEPHQELTDEMILELKNQHFNIISLYVNTDGNGKEFIQVEVPHTEMQEGLIKEIVLGVAKEHDAEINSVQVKKIDVAKMQQDNRWAVEIVSPLSEQMKNEQFKVKSVGYTLDPSPTLIIQSSVSSSELDSKNYSLELEKRITEMLESDEMKDSLKGDSYKIEIYSKEGTKLN
ncbi:hypothetical protein JOC85_001128 [Bacillus mesophilus]|uniref:DUF4030 domain-containing protein n=1 Tax=Bacillus mesophilus TaxID=1808955 RepID=A0A6M0Q6H7_9BACI|nr:DUF4030 domain-containing protein [Bacillus mesophilus]MBM7660361.1 hypothetical protein [Bacillus mesophilus]NEY71070.1 DUF4030 domain-containing protein [Bacillus mesophilus]